MKAWVLHNRNDIRYESVDKPVLDDQEVLVAVKAAGICGSDIPRIYQTGAHRHPLIPGHEFSGVVEQIGADVEPFWEGKRVGIFPLIPCGSCLPCTRQQYEMCRSYSYLGSRRDGGFAEYVAVPKGCLVSLPDGVSYEEAAMLEPMAVAVHAMRGIMRDNSGTVVVCGLGTIGLMLLMFLLEADVQAFADVRSEANTQASADGQARADVQASADVSFQTDVQIKTGAQNAKQMCRILAVGNKESQRQAVLRMGLPEDCYCDGRTQDAAGWIMQHTQGNGADVFFECVGKNETLTQAVDCAAPAGKIMLVGNPYSDMQLEKAVYWKILRNQLTVKGTWNSSFLFGNGAGGMHEAADGYSSAQDDWQYVLERLAGKRIAPAELISHRFDLDKLERGLSIMRDKTEDYIKIMALI